MNKRVIVLASLLALSPVSRGQIPASNAIPPAGLGMAALLRSELSKLDLQNPEKDLERNLATNDHRLIGLYGFVLYCPGAEDLPRDRIERYGIRPINGTSDCILGAEHQRLIQSATDYATRYNKALIQRFRASELQGPEK